MGDYIKPWRRKFGVLTLVMACLFMSAWMRGLHTNDAITFGLDDQKRQRPEYTCCQLVFGDGIKLRRFKIKNASIGLSNGWKTYPSTRDAFHLSRGKTTQKWQTLGFASEETTFANNHIITLSWAIPYWSIVIPLTLLSAWLLLNKPRKSYVKPISESIPKTAM